MSTNDKCLSEEVLLRYLDHDSGQEEEAMVRQHLAQCDFCRDAVDGLSHYLETGSSEELKSTLDGLSHKIDEKSSCSKDLKEEPIRNFFYLRRWTFASIAASVLLVISIGIGIRFVYQGHNRELALEEFSGMGKDKSLPGEKVQFLPPPKPDRDGDRADGGKEVFTVVEESPVFPGGDEALNKFLSANISCSADLKNTGKPGSMFVNFVIEEDGTISNVKMISEVGDGCSEEAIRGIEAMPKWIPGKQGGQNVRVSYMLLLRFS